MGANNKDKANMLGKAFQKVHSSESLSEDNRKRSEEIISREQDKLQNSYNTPEVINLYFSMKELKSAIKAGARVEPRDGRADLQNA